MKYTPLSAIEEYRKALPWLNILSQDPSKVDRTSVDLELESYKREVAELWRKMELFMVKNEECWRKIEQK